MNNHSNIERKHSVLINCPRAQERRMYGDEIDLVIHRKLSDYHGMTVGIHDNDHRFVFMIYYWYLRPFMFDHDKAPMNKKYLTIDN